MSSAALLQRKTTLGAVTKSPPLISIALAAIAERVNGDVLSNDPRLVRLHAAPEQVDDWRSDLDRLITDPAPQDASLSRLARSLQLTGAEVLALAFAVNVEFDLEIAVLLTALQEPMNSSRPTVGLIARIWPDGETCAIGALVQGKAVRSGLLVLADSPDPLPQRTMSVPVPLALAVQDQPSQWPGAQSGLAPEQRIPMPPSEERRARQRANALKNSPDARTALRSSSLLEAKSVATMFADELGLQPLFLSDSPLPGLAPWLLLRKMLPVFCLNLGPGERRPFPQIAEYEGPALALMGLDGELETGSGPALTWKIEVPSALERESLWSQHVDDALAVELATQYRLRAGRIFDLGRLGAYEGAMCGKEQLDRSDIHCAVRSGESTGLSALAELISEEVPEEALIVSRQLRRDLETLCLRCCSRERLVDYLGVSARVRYRPSVQALFVGPSGTGKTLAALWLASRLGLPLYRVDLAEISSKYVGETEKNLSHLLSCAEQAGVILLFDEADSIFGRRTEVRDANDRFANAQTNYLLQRMENFDGITILTSNSRTRMDSAFSRRLEMILEFSPPDPAQRRSLWESHLGERHDLTPPDINYLAVSLDLTGGEIRNAVLTAAVRASSRNAHVDLAGILQGVQDEYRKLGRHLPDDLMRKAVRGPGQ